MKRKHSLIAIMTAAAVLASAGTAAASRYIGFQKASNAPSTGITDTVVIPVAFSDCVFEQEEIEELQQHFYGEQKYQEGQPFRSLSAYFAYQSRGRLQVKGSVLPVYAVNKTAEEHNKDSTKLIKDALRYYESQGMDLSQYDLNGNRCIDHVFLKFPMEVNVFMSSMLRDDFEVSGIKLMGYSRSGCDVEDYIEYHEFGHTLGMTDYYRWNKQKLLDDELMNRNRGYINTYEKYILEWIDPIIVSGTGLQDVTISRQELEQSEHPQAVIIIPDDSLLPFTEFYMAEYRKDQKLYVWKLDAAIDMTIISHPRFGDLPDGRYLKKGYQGDPYLEGVIASGDPGVLVSQDQYPNNGDFCNNVFTGTYIELLETAEDTATLRVGIQENNGKAPVLLETNHVSGSIVEKDECSFAFTFDTAIQSTGNCVLEDADTGETQEIECIANGNILSVNLMHWVEDGASYVLTIPPVTDSAGNAAAEFQFSFRTAKNVVQKSEQRKTWDLKEIQSAADYTPVPACSANLSWQGNTLFYGETSLGKMEPTDQTCAWTQPDGCGMVLSQKKGEWLGYRYPVLSKISDEGVLLWQMEYDGLGGHVSILASDLSQRAVYIQTDKGIQRFVYYEDGETGAEVSVSHRAGRYREPVKNLELSAPEGYEIFYTLDGSDPRFYGRGYEEPLSLPRSCKLRAVPFKDGVFGREWNGNYYFTSDPKKPMLYRFDRYLSIAAANDGTFLDTGGKHHSYPAGYFDFSDFYDIIDIDFSENVVLGIRANGTVAAAGDINHGYPDLDYVPPEEFEELLSNSQDMLQIKEKQTALKKDGTVHTWLWSWGFDDTELQSYEDIVQISDFRNLYLLQENGTVIKLEHIGYTSGQVLGWKEIVGIFHYPGGLIGLDQNGTVWFYNENKNTTHKIWEGMETVNVSEKYISGLTKKGESIYTNTIEGKDGVLKYSEIQKKTKRLFEEDVIDVLWCSSVSYGLRGDGTIAVRNTIPATDALEEVNWNLLPKRHVDILADTLQVEQGCSQKIPFDFDWIDRKTVAWTSSNDNVVKVEPDGRITAVQPGTATVTARSAVDPNAVDSVRVTVSGRELPCTVSITDATDAQLKLSMFSNSYTGTAYVLTGYFENGRCIGTKIMNADVSAGSVENVTIPLPARCDEARFYVWQEDMQPLSYPICYTK